MYTLLAPSVAHSSLTCLVEFLCDRLRGWGSCCGGGLASADDHYDIDGANRRWASRAATAQVRLKGSPP
jgi:hypothetical protein